MSTTPQNQNASQSPPSLVKTASRRTKILVVLLFIAAALLGREYPKYSAHRTALTRLQQELARRRIVHTTLHRDEVAAFLTGVPTKQSESGPDPRFDYYSWRGLLYSYHIRVEFNPTEEVLLVENLPYFEDSRPNRDQPLAAFVPTPISAQEVDLALSQAELIVRNSGDGNEVRHILRSVIDGLPLAKVSTVKGQLHWNSFRFPTNGRRLFAIQFEVPPEEPVELDFVRWTNSGGSSGIFSYGDKERSPSEHTEESRKTDYVANVQTEGVDLPMHTVVWFGSRSLNYYWPVKRFIWWFRIDDQAPIADFECKVALFLSKAGKFPERRGAHEICEHIGLQTNIPKFPPTPDGLREAFMAIEQRQASRILGPAAYHRILSPVLSALPEVTVSTPGQPHWHKIEFSYGSCTAVRVRIPNSVGTKGDLYGAALCTRPGNFGWNGHDRSRGDFQSRTTVNAKVADDLPQPPNRLTVFSHARGLLNPGEEIALWVQGFQEPAENDQSAPIYLTLTVVPHGETRENAKLTRIHADRQPWSSGKLLGVDVPSPAAPEGCHVLGWHEREILQLFFTPDNRRLVSIDELRQARIWNVESLQSEGQIKLADAVLHENAMVDPDSQMLVMFDHVNRPLLRWNLDTREPISPLAVAASQNDFLTAVAFRTQPNQLVVVPTSQVSSSQIGTEWYPSFSTHDPATNQWSAKKVTERGEIKSLVFLSSLNLFAAGITRVVMDSENHVLRSVYAIQLWPHDFAKPIQELPLTDRPRDFSSNDLLLLRLGDIGPIQLSCHPNSRRLAAICRRGQLKVWDIGTGTELLSESTETPLLTVSLSSDGETVATTEPDSNTVTLWNLSTGQKKPAWQADDVPITHVAHSSDGKWVATANADGVIRLWKIAP